LPLLVESGYSVICCVREINKFHVVESLKNKIQVIELDLTQKDTLNNIPQDIDFAYYLVALV